MHLEWCFYNYLQQNQPWHWLTSWRMRSGMVSYGSFGHTAGKWPIAEATDLALLALSCVEIYRRDRPDLRDQILPKLEMLKEAADSIRDEAILIQSGPPSHFFCPILQEVMTEPCVAADGYTYDRNAIEKWLEKKENSPMTNLPMPSKNLIPNYTLLSAIMEWKSGTS
ncbi:unnamed protein product [Rhodiola kirilowii]